MALGSTPEGNINAIHSQASQLAEDWTVAKTQRFEETVKGLYNNKELNVLIQNRIKPKAEEYGDNTENYEAAMKKFATFQKVLKLANSGDAMSINVPELKTAIALLDEYQQKHGSTGAFGNREMRSRLG